MKIKLLARKSLYSLKYPEEIERLEKVGFVFEDWICNGHNFKSVVKNAVVEINSLEDLLKLVEDVGTIQITSNHDFIIDNGSCHLME